MDHSGDTGNCNRIFLYDSYSAICNYICKSCIYSLYRCHSINLIYLDWSNETRIRIKCWNFHAWNISWKCESKYFLFWNIFSFGIIEVERKKKKTVRERKKEEDEKERRKKKIPFKHEKVLIFLFPCSDTVSFKPGINIHFNGSLYTKVKVVSKVLSPEYSGNFFSLLLSFFLFHIFMSILEFTNCIILIEFVFWFENEFSVLNYSMI